MLAQVSVLPSFLGLNTLFLFVNIRFCLSTMCWCTFELFPPFAIVNSVALNICVQVSECFLYFVLITLKENFLIKLFFLSIHICLLPKVWSGSSKRDEQKTDNRQVLLDQPSCTNVLQILLRKDLVSLKPTTQRGQRSDPESIRASCSPHWTSLGMMPALLRSEAVQWPIAKKSLCSALWANQTPELNLCTSSVLSSLIFSSATWWHQLKSCSLPRQANKCSFVSDYCLVVFVSFLLMVLTKVGNSKQLPHWWRLYSWK